MSNEPELNVDRPKLLKEINSLGELRRKSMRENSSVVELNQERRKLIKEINELQEKQVLALNAIHDIIAKDFPNFAEETFHIGIDWQRTSCEKRLYNLFNMMQKEIQDVELTIGVNMEDAEEELELKFNNLRNKEKDYDIIELQMTRPLKNTQPYQEALEHLRANGPTTALNHQIPVSDIIQSILSNRIDFEEKYNHILHTREEELQTAIQEIQHKFIEKRAQQQQLQKLESVAKHAHQIQQEKTFIAFEPYLDHVHAAYQRYYNNEFQNAHEECMHRYKHVLDRQQQQLQSRSQQSIPKKVSYPYTHPLPSVNTIPPSSSWKMEMVHDYDQFIYQTLEMERRQGTTNEQFYAQLQGTKK